MTKNYDPKDVQKEPRKDPSAIAKAAEKFPSPPQKDGTADPETILDKKRREEREAETKRRMAEEGYQPGFKTGSKKAKEAAKKAGGGK